MREEEGGLRGTATCLKLGDTFRDEKGKIGGRPGGESGRRSEGAGGEKFESDCLGR